ncbi:unnamed protein product [Orchesella dallaii]|uniref:Cytochrome P450 n=1 Tax=Orchesella dallaii TaxID=48710 RepID=A0ABP1RKI6_9HEXA
MISILVWMIALVALFIHRRQFRMSILQRHGIPGPKPNLWWGNLFEYLKTPNVEWDSQLVEKYGPVCGYYMGAKPVILLAEPSLIHTIQTNHDFLDRPRRVPGGINPDPKRAKMLGNLGVSDWKNLRGILDKAFSPQKLKGMSHHVAALVNVFMSRIAPNDDVSINFYPLYQDLTLDLIGKTGFGLDSDIQMNPNDELKKAVDQEFSKSTGTFLLKLFLCFPEIQCVLQPIRVLLEKAKHWMGFGGHSELWNLGRNAVLQRKNQPQADATDLLQVMLDSGRLDETSIVANSVLFFEAGFETLSAGLAFITYLMIKHPEVQEDVRNEIRDILKGSGGKMDCFHLKQFRILDAAIQEALRMFPPQTTFIGRSGSSAIHREYSWKGQQLKCIIPANVHVQVGLYQILNSDEIWESPRRYNPDRFQPGTTLNQEQSFAFQPFGNGKRMCIGKKYADMALKMLLVPLLSKYKLVRSDETEDDISVIYKTATMTPKKGVFGKPVADPLFPEEELHDV